MPLLTTSHKQYDAGNADAESSAAGDDKVNEWNGGNARKEIMIPSKCNVKKKKGRVENNAK